ncbi:MAG: LuxR family transcriptional regulator [Actinomycetales bacterium]|nr:LuxR family transcriptional regulator [Actinomycetales bacterium]
MRADVVERQLTGLARSGLDSDAFAQGALDLLQRAVPFESACLAFTDPVTELLTGTVKLDLPDARDAEFARLEYETDDINQFQDIASREVPVGVLSLDTEGHPERSRRFREFLVPHFDQGNELRAACRVGGQTWGLLGLYRPTAATGFSPAEAAFVASIAPLLASGIRAGLVVEAADPGREPADGPAVLVVSGTNDVVQASSGVVRRLADLGADPWGELPISLSSVVSAARSYATGRSETPARARIRTAAGTWLVVHASTLSSPHGSRGDVVVTIEEARPPEIVPLVVAAFALTDREREVVRLVLAGSSTQEIAAELFLSPYTVQDHLKSIFVKAGVSSRRELLARVFFEQYAPRIGGTLSATGWFTAD